MFSKLSEFRKNKIERDMFLWTYIYLLYIVFLSFIFSIYLIFCWGPHSQTSSGALEAMVPWCHSGAIDYSWQRHDRSWCIPHAGSIRHSCWTWLKKVATSPARHQPPTAWVEVQHMAAALGRLLDRLYEFAVDLSHQTMRFSPQYKYINIYKYI